MDAEARLQEAAERLQDAGICAILSRVDRPINEVSPNWQDRVTIQDPSEETELSIETYIHDPVGFWVLRVYQAGKKDGDSTFTIDETEVDEDDWSVDEIVEDASRTPDIAS